MRIQDKIKNNHCYKVRDKNGSLETSSKRLIINNRQLMSIGEEIWSLNPRMVKVFFFIFNKIILVINRDKHISKHKKKRSIFIFYK